MPSSAAGFAAAGREKPAVASGAASSMSESFAMGESSLQGMRDTGSRTGETVFRSEEHTSELQSLMRISYAVFCLKKKTNRRTIHRKENVYIKAQRNQKRTDELQIYKNQRTVT